ncbi:MAG TPA: deoxyribose-phosphate aldolase [Oscillospiraceae bacterium]|nr:deoxyribose-phosphate aldolase [Oscillospiraceae bacterium]
MEIEKIMSKIDNTLLKPTAIWDDIKALCEESLKYKMASVCIPMCYIKDTAEFLEKKLPVCTVIGFPLGYSSSEAKLFEARESIKLGADEIDMVINIGKLKSKDYDYIKNEISRIREAAADKILKVIIETCYLNEDEKIKMCEIVTETGADFIKTSTGFGTDGATLEDIKLFSQNIGKNVKIKAAGGIRTIGDAVDFINAGAERLGTSAGAKIYQAYLSGDSGQINSAY